MADINNGHIIYTPLNLCYDGVTERQMIIYDLEDVEGEPDNYTLKSGIGEVMKNTV